MKPDDRSIAGEVRGDEQSRTALNAEIEQSLGANHAARGVEPHINGHEVAAEAGGGGSHPRRAGNRPSVVCSRKCVVLTPSICS